VKIATSEFPSFGKHWSPDGRRAIYTAITPDYGVSSYLLDAEAGTSKAFLTGQRVAGFTKAQGQISPDGKWVAYTSSETGRLEVYVQSLLSPGKQWLISTEGGNQPRWRGDGRELFFLQGDRLYSVVIRRASDDTFDVSLPTALFQVPATGGSTIFSYVYDVAKDGQRFLFTKATDDGAARPMTVVTNWQALLRP
jgi:Tol biopolymer transport system component